MKQQLGACFMSQACSEIAKNVIFLSTISLLPLRVTENEADCTSETLPSEGKLKNCLLIASPFPGRWDLHWNLALDERSLKFTLSYPGRVPLPVSGLNHIESCVMAISSVLWPRPSFTRCLYFQPSLLMCFEGAGEMRFLFIKNHRAFLWAPWGFCVRSLPTIVLLTLLIHFPSFLLTSSFQCVVPTTNSISITWDL